MDPNATLEELREVLQAGETAADIDQVRALVLFSALDDWLSNGGFPPDEWRGWMRHRCEGACRP